MQEVISNFNKLEKKIEEIFININTNARVRIVHETIHPGIYIVFGKANIRSTIRIYPSDKENVFIYAIGNSQKNLSTSEILERFPNDLENILTLFERNITTAPIDALPEFKKQRQMDLVHNENKIDEEDKHLTTLPDDEFIRELRQLTKLTIENHKIDQKIQNEKKESQVSFLIHSFINQVSRSYRKDAIAEAKKGKNNLRYCLNSVISSNYLLKEFKSEDIKTILEEKSIKARLSNTFKGFEYSINIINQSFKPHDIVLSLKW